MDGRPLTPPCVPVGTRRFNGSVRFCIACSMVPVIDFDAFEVSLSSTLLSSFSCVCITAISYQSTFFSLLRLPLFSPSRSVCAPSTRDIPLHSTTASADFWMFNHTSLYGLLWIPILVHTVQTVYFSPTDPVLSVYDPRKEGKK